MKRVVRIVLEVGAWVFFGGPPLGMFRGLDRLYRWSKSEDAK